VVVSGLAGGGAFSISGSAPVDSAGATVARWRAAIDRWSADTPTERALDPVRRRAVGAWTLQFETLAGWIAQWMAARTHGLPDETLNAYPARVATLQGPALRAAVSQWVAPERMLVVAIGPAARLRAQLEALGTVEVLSTDAATQVVEAPSTTTAPPTPEQMVRGRTIAGRAAAAHGGLERLRQIQDSSIQADMVMTPGPRQYSGRVTQLRKEPGLFRFTTAFPYLHTVQALDGRRGWVQVGDPADQVEDLDSVAVIGLQAGFRSDIVHLLLLANDPSSRAAWRGQERRDDRDVDVLEVVAGDGERRLLFLDAASHQLVAMEQNEEGHSVRRIYRDLRTVDGVLWPFSEERLLDGQRAMALTWTRVAFNTGLKDSEFRKPGSRPPPPAPAAAPSRPRPR
ncbi:MAG TPA: hypothetical protein VJY35_04675, partial [Candidatus Eisenbacteria bacterium]|nr:hypothetical protein [Candidatus Eisenbacteria bacterium]